MAAYPEYPEGLASLAFLEPSLDIWAKMVMHVSRLHLHDACMIEEVYQIIIWTVAGTNMLQVDRRLYRLQVENEYGFIGEDKPYIRHLVGLVRQHLGNEILIYTTDPPDVVHKGSLPGDEVFS